MFVYRSSDVVVESDKLPHEVSAARVTFQDESCCDLRTLQVHYVGSGFIQVTKGQRAKPVDTVTTAPMSFEAAELELRCPDVDVDISIHGSPDLEIVISGLPEEIATLQFDLEGRLLLISGGVQRSGRRLDSPPTRGSLLRKLIGLLCVSRRTDTSIRAVFLYGSTLKVSVKVPSGTLFRQQSGSGTVQLPYYEA